MDKSSMLRHRLASPVVNEPVVKRLARIPRQEYLRKRQTCSIASQTDPVNPSALCPTLHARLRMLELQNEEIKRLVRKQLGIKLL